MGTIRTPIHYSCVSYNGKILVSHQVDAENYAATVHYILTELSRGGPRKLTCPIDCLQVHLVVDNDCWVYCCITSEKGNQLLAFTFLEYIQKRFNETGSLVNRSPTAAENEFDRDFGPILSSVMHDFNSGQGDKISILKSQVEDVKQIMLKNVEKIIDRGERLEDLLSKTEDLEAKGSGFRQRARELHTRAKCKNLKMWLLISGFLGTVLIIALLIATGIIRL